MAGSRKYRRDKNGRFAGSGGGTVTTTGRAGGFASASHRANVAAARNAKGNKVSTQVMPAKAAAARRGPQPGNTRPAPRRRSLLTKKEKSQLKKQLLVIGGTYAIGQIARQVMVSRAGKLAAASAQGKRTAASARLAGNTLTTQRGQSGRYGSLPKATARKRRSGTYKISSL